MNASPKTPDNSTECRTIDPRSIYQCPGEDYPITRSVHLARLAAFYPKCRDCPQRGETVPLALPREDVHEEATVRPPRPSLFTAEGVRGVYLNELTRSKAGAIAGALASCLWEGLPRMGQLERNAERSTATVRSGPAVVIAHDERPSSPDIITGVGAALRHMGCQVIDIGLATRPCFRFAVDHLQAAAGIHVCGAGCDPAWTGLDFVTRGACPCSQGGQLDQIQARFEHGYARPSRRPGSQRTFHAALPYEAGLWKHFHALRPLRIAFACSSRPVRDLMLRLFKKLACQLDPVVTPTRLRNMGDPNDADCQRTARAVSQTGAHLGVLVDDDGQRCAFFNEGGELVAARDMTRILAQDALVDNPGRNIVLQSAEASPSASSYDVRAINDMRASSGEATGPASSEDFELAKSISEFGGRCVWVPPRCGAVAEVMRSDEALFAGGDSGRYWFPESFPACDAVLTLAKVLQALSRSDATFSEIVRS